MSLPHLTVGPTGPADALVVWLHGLGASGHDFEPLVPHLGLPDVRFVFPHAPMRPVTVNGGYVMPSWYDIKFLGAGDGREDVAQLQQSADAVEALIAEHVAAGVPEDRVIIAGFSQGGAVTMELLTRRARRFRGGLVMSSYLVGHPGDWSSANEDTPVWFAHGRRDDVVPLSRGRAAHDAWATSGRPAAWSDYPMGHELCGPQVADLRGVLHGWLG